jgi:glycosyltransferase involved in cell wall biosynthesis
MISRRAAPHLDDVKAHALPADKSKAPGEEPPRKASICFPFDGAAFGGAVVSGMILAEELLKRGWKVAFAVHGSGRTLHKASESSVPVHRLPALGQKSEWERQDAFRLGNLALIPSCIRYLLARQPTLVHINDARMLRTWAIPAVLVRRPVVVHWRSIYHNSVSVNVGLRAASRIIAISRSNAENLPDWAKRKTDIVFNPFKPSISRKDAEAKRSTIRANLGLPQNAAVVGFFGNLVFRKRPHVLIDILAAVPTTAAGAPVYGLLCGGRIEPVDTLLDERRAALGATDRVIEAGFIDEPEEWMAACDVVMLPAVDEPFGRVVIEAQGVGVPVVVSKQCGVSEVIEHGVSGFVLDAYDIDNWIEHVKMVLNSRALAAQLVAGGSAVAERLTVDAHVSSIERLYEKLQSPVH